MYHDLQDGKKLILLLEILSGEKLVRAPHICKGLSIISKQYFYFYLILGVSRIFVKFYSRSFH